VKRREAREIALKILYELDLNPEDPDEVLKRWREEKVLSGDSWEFIKRLVKGVTHNKDVLDGYIQQVAHRWKVERMDKVDRNILRMGVYELLFCDDIPLKVAINEAVELGKKFGSSDESKGFINAILDKIAKTTLLGERDGGEGQKDMDGRRIDTVGRS